MCCIPNCPHWWRLWNPYRYTIRPLKSLLRSKRYQASTSTTSTIEWNYSSLFIGRKSSLTTGWRVVYQHTVNSYSVRWCRKSCLSNSIACYRKYEVMATTCPMVLANYGFNFVSYTKSVASVNSLHSFRRSPDSSNFSGWGDYWVLIHSAIFLPHLPTSTATLRPYRLRSVM